jgi:hypothetical protein
MEFGSALPTTDRSVDTVASLPVTIDRDESDVFATPIEAVPPSLRTAQTTELRDYAATWVAHRETTGTTRSERSTGRRGRSQTPRSRRAGFVSPPPPGERRGAAGGRVRAAAARRVPDEDLR